jgi:hypothetical protein
MVDVLEMNSADQLLINTALLKEGYSSGSKEDLVMWNGERNSKVRPCLIPAGMKRRATANNSLGFFSASRF